MRNRKGNRTRQERWQEVKLVWKNSLSLTGTLTYTMLHIYLHSHTHTHIHSSLLPQCFGQSARVKIPKVIMKFNYNSLGNSMEMSSVPKGWELHSTAQQLSQGQRWKHQATSRQLRDYTTELTFNMAPVTGAAVCRSHFQFVCQYSGCELQTQNFTSVVAFDPNTE